MGREPFKDQKNICRMPEHVSMMIEVELPHLTLGTIITEGQIVVNPVKAAAIVDWPIPKKLRDVESFLGTINLW
jgi:hypothetical protein